MPFQEKKISESATLIRQTILSTKSLVLLRGGSLVNIQTYKYKLLLIISLLPPIDFQLLFFDSRTNNFGRNKLQT